MAVDVTHWIGPLAIFHDEGPLGSAYDGRAYRGAHPPRPEPLFIVVGAAADAHEAAWRAHGAAVSSLPRVVVRAGRATAFEFVAGVSLLDLFALTRETSGELPIEVAVFVVEQLARALPHLQSHEQVEPIAASNVRVGFDGRVVLFAAAWMREAMESIIGAGIIRGAGLPRSAPFESGLAYEELMGLGNVDARRADVFRLGCLLQHMLDGDHPFNADTPMHALERIAHGRRQPLRRDVPPAFAYELTRALAREPAERHEEPGAFVAALRSALPVDDDAARAALGGITCGLFPLAREEQALFLEELGTADLDLTIPSSAMPDPTLNATEQWRRDRMRHVVVSLRPRLYIDRHLVTHADFLAYLDATGDAPPPRFVGRIAELAYEPLTMITPAQIARFAAWRGGRLPTEAEWVRGARCGSLADLTRVWEWTSTAATSPPSAVKYGGFRVRGGPWRDRDEPGRVDHVSWEYEPASDVGFRLAYDHTVAGAYYIEAARDR